MGLIPETFRRLSQWLIGLKAAWAERRRTAAELDKRLDADLFDDYAGETEVSVPIEDAIDLHHYRPDEVSSLLREYFAACRRKGIYEVRVIHGKGKGRLRAGVLAFLDREPSVDSYAEAPAQAGGWGAVIVRLKPDDKNE